MAKKIIIIKQKEPDSNLEETLQTAFNHGEDSSLESFDTPCENCPKCSSDNISNEDAPEDQDLTVTCHDCSFQWVEPDLTNLN